MIRRLLTCVLLALVLAPARAANRDSSQWEKEIQAFEASDRTNPPPTNAVLFVGSSSIRLWSNLADLFPGLTTIRRGFGGSQIPDQIAFADRIIFKYHPAAIVLYAGENDIARGDSPEDVAKAFREFVKLVETKQPGTPIYFISMKPSPSRWHLSPQEREANRLIRSYCAHHRNLQFVDIWPTLLNENGQPDPALFQKDRLHINQKGYARWAEVIRKALKK